MDGDIPGPGAVNSAPLSLADARVPEISSDDELEMALPAVPEPQEDEVLVDRPVESAATAAPSTEEQSLPPPLPMSSPFKLPPNPAIPQDLSIIAEFVNSYQAVGSLPPLSMTASEKRKAVEASIRAKTAALQKSKGTAKEPEAGDTVKQKENTETEVNGDSDSSSEFESDVEAADMEIPDKRMSAEEHAAIKVELDRLVAAPPGDDDDSDGSSDSSSEYETDDSEPEGEAGTNGPAEFVFSDSPPPTPRKRPLKYEVIEDDEEPAPSGPILSANEAPLPPVPQPPFSQLPAEEKLSLAGEVISWMREKKVEAWWEKQGATEHSAIDQTGDDEAMEDGEVKETEGDEPSASSSAPVSTIPMPKFGSSGTVVLRAMQERPGQEGWLEEGSVVCYPDGKVLGFVSDTFGPLTSPFYSIRLPPPPFPYPASNSLTSGTRLSYPINPSYRSFVNMLAVRDPRLKGSDASNIHDEEVGEEEMEWSDDEAEAEAKRRKKNKRSDSAREKAWASGPTPGQGGPAIPFAPLPPRPHFDYNPDDSTDAASFYGDEVGETEFDDLASVSEAGSSASRRPAPMPYDLDEGGPASPVASTKEEEGSQRGKREGGESGRSRGRGQGRQRGGGRGGGRDDKGGRGGRGGRGGGRGREERGGARGRGRGGSRDDRGGRASGSGNSGRAGAGSAQAGGRPGFNLPTKPNFDPLAIGPVATSPHLPTPPPSTHPVQTCPAGYNPAQPFMPPSPGGFRLQPQSHYAPPPSNNHFQQQHQAQHHQYPHQQHQHPDQQHFHPQSHFQSFPQTPSSPPQRPYPHQQYQHQSPAPPPGNDGPAINPRFAAQYQQMQMMSQLAAWGGQGQGPPGGPGQGQGQGGAGGYGRY